MTPWVRKEEIEVWDGSPKILSSMISLNRAFHSSSVCQAPLRSKRHLDTHVGKAPKPLFR